MSNAQHKVLIVDDDRFSQKMIVRALKAQYDVKTADDGEQGLAFASHWQPEAILLDVEMPGKNGYEVCEALKCNPVTANIPVLFLSGKDSQREKLLGFELGAEDYIVKPFEAEILSAKVARAIKQYVERATLSYQASLAQETAFEAMTSSAELGRALRFTEHTYAITSFAVLANALFQILDEFGLKTSVMFESKSGTLYFSHNSAEISPLEKDLMQINHTNGHRFMDFGSRTFCNFRQTCLLIKNMPLDNPERYGRIKDVVPFILGAVDGKIRALDMHNALTAQSKMLAQSVESIGFTLNALTQEVSSSHAGITQVMKNLLVELEVRLPLMGLEDDQEKYLISRIDQSFNEALSELNRSLGIGQSLAGVVRLLDHLHSQQQEMVKSTSDEPAASVMPNDGDSLSGDVELF